MTVTELATIFLQSPNTGDSTPLLAVLEKAKRVQEKASGYPAYYFKNTSNPNIIYIIGTWESQESHMAFLPQKENQEILELVMPFCAAVNPVTLKHVDMELKRDREVGFIDWEEIGVVHYGVELKWKSEFEKWIKEPGDGGMLGKYGGFWGWELERAHGAEELIVLMKMTDVVDFVDRSLEEMPSRIPVTPVEYDNETGSTDIVKWSSFKARRLPGL